MPALAAVDRPLTSSETGNGRGAASPSGGRGAERQYLRFSPDVLAVLRLFAAGALIAGIVYTAWAVRAERYLTPENGLGYALGIAGGALMLMLLLYPLRKKVRFMRAVGSVRYWFRVHMAFGVLGPVLILFHANFGLGSLNSNVALLSMVLVAASGMVGRYFYTRIHHGLFGRRASLKSLQEEAEDNRSALGEVFACAPDLKDRLLAFEARVSAPSRGILDSVGRLAAMGLRTWWSRACLRVVLHRALADMAGRKGWSASERRRRQRVLRHHVSAHLSALRRVAEFTFYERLFRLWHVLHLPLFFMLLISGVVHVLAVHLY